MEFSTLHFASAMGKVELNIGNVDMRSLSTNMTDLLEIFISSIYKANLQGRE